MNTAAPDDRLSMEGVETWKLRAIGAFAIIAVVLYCNPGPFFRPELWAEDGAEFLAGPLVDGFWSCFQPIAFNFLILERFVAFLAVEFLPLRLVPVVFSWVPLLVAAFVLSSLVNDDMRWIHPDRRFRLAVVVGLAFLPALNEVTMALCNGTYIVGLAAFLFCLRDNPRFNVAGASAMAILMLSSTITFLVPLIWMWRSLFERDERATHLRFLAVSMAPLLLMVVSALLNPFATDTGLVHIVATPAYGLAPFDILVLVEIFVVRLGVLVVGFPLIGSDLTTTLMQGGGLFWITSLIAPIVLYGFWRVNHRLVLGVLLGLALFPLMHLGRNYGPFLNLERGLVLPVQRWSLVAEVFVFIGYATMAAGFHGAFRWLISIPMIHFGYVTLCLQTDIGSEWEEMPKQPFTAVAEVIESQREAIAAGETGTILTPIIPVHPYHWGAFRVRLQR